MNNLILSAIVLVMLGQPSNATEVIQDGKEYPLEKMKEQSKKIIKMVVEEISKNLPQKVDKYTQITNIRDENLTLIYTFEINTGVKSDEAVKKEDKERMGKNITKGICQSSKRFLDAGVTLRYEYMSASTKNELFTFTMTQEICSELKHD